jgi:predicted transcriptional regulator
VANVPLQTQVLGILRKYTEGATVLFVAQTLGLPPETVASVMESLYVSSMVECRRLGQSIDLYRLPRWN